MQPASNPSSSHSSDCGYAQLVSSILGPYDATLVFYQTHPVQAEKGGLNDFRMETREVARVVLPHRSLKELSDLLLRQVSEMPAKASEDDTIAKLKKGEKRSR